MLVTRKHTLTEFFIFGKKMKNENSKIKNGKNMRYTHNCYRLLAMELCQKISLIFGACFDKSMNGNTCNICKTGDQSIMVQYLKQILIGIALRR